MVNELTDTWYTVTEVRSPTGYVLDNTPKTVELLPGKTTTIKISNYKKPSLTIKKIDEQTGEGLSGVVLRVTMSGAMEYLVGAFPDGNSALMLVCARLRHVAGSQWGSKRCGGMTVSI